MTVSQQMREKIIKLYNQHGAIPVKCQGADSLPLDVIVDFQKGLKKRSKKNLLKLIDLIFTLGFIDPFTIWDKDGSYLTIDGHGRDEALLTIREVVPEALPDLFPVNYIFAETVEEAKAALLAISSSFGDFDMNELDSWLSGLDDEIRQSLRFMEGEIKIKGAIPETFEDDEVPEKIKSITHRGDVWTLNKHRLICGDSGAVDVLDLLLGKELFDFVFTDPPYNVDMDRKNKMLQDIGKAGKVKVITGIDNDAVRPEQLRDLLVAAFTNMKAKSQECCSYYITAPQNGEIGYMVQAVLTNDCLLPPRHVIIWTKNRKSFGFGRSLDYAYQHEPIYYTWNKKHIFYGQGLYNSTVWPIDVELKCDLHPTIKPVVLIVNAIMNSTEKGQIIGDLFVGSGTSLIAAEKTGRVCRAVDNDPYCVDVCVHRFVTWCKVNSIKCDLTLNGKRYIL